ncbi:unnamed protein product [Schistosoma curassoni]|uniref:Legumain n=1 Tax=Schistosoma curassoni TaxID=6186 RepID=A0A183K0A7_9TREM|nr:unnamed protein product [Schistosoma curassoni]
MLRFSLFLIHCLFIVFVQSRFNSTIEYFDENLSDKNKWAILVAGSNGFDNYRHQADVCHAYHVLRSKGIKPEHIITMMYDDIAHNKILHRIDCSDFVGLCATPIPKVFSSLIAVSDMPFMYGRVILLFISVLDLGSDAACDWNPFRGKIFNDYSHRDWYKGVVIDYKGNVWRTTKTNDDLTENHSVCLRIVVFLSQLNLLQLGLYKKNVNSETFLKVLKGDKSAGGKVLKSWKLVSSLPQKAIAGGIRPMDVEYLV